jgi:hypothetical protein
MRFAVMHVWPEFRYLLSSVPATALVEVGVVEDDERRDPVNPSFRTSGLEVISAPMAGASAASPVTIESTPTGSPASSARTPTASADSGVCSAGFSTIVHPAASAGAAFRVTIADGEFHGVIPAETPTGSCSTRIRRSESGEGIVSGEEQGEIVEVLEHQSPQRRMIRARSAADRLRQPGSARAAASSARRVSAAPTRATRASSSAVAGFVTANVSRESESTQPSSTNACSRRNAVSAITAPRASRGSRAG